MATIKEHFDEKLSYGEIEEDSLIVAQNNIMASKTRLIAELSWFPNLNPNAAEKIKELIKESDYINLSNALKDLDGLSLANVASFLCQKMQGSPEIINHLFDAQSQFDTTSILNNVNGNRSMAGFPNVNKELVENSITKIRELHADSAIEFISNSEHPGILFSSIVEKFILIPEIAPFLDEVAEKYNSWAIHKIRDYESQIKKITQELKQGNSLEISIKKLTELLNNWDEYSQPLQLISQAKGLDESHSKEIYQEMRDICFWLVNEKNSVELTLKFVQSLREIFPELPSVLDQIEDDIDTLEELLEKPENNSSLINLIKESEEVLNENDDFKDINDFFRSIMDGNFRPKGSGLAGGLYQKFIKAVDNTRGKNNEVLPWLILQKLAIQINNKFDKPEVAAKILEGIINVSPPSSVIEKLLHNQNIINSNTKINRQNKGSIISSILSYFIRTASSIIIVIIFAAIFNFGLYILFNIFDW